MSKLPPQRALKNVALFAGQAINDQPSQTIPLTKISLPPSQPRRYFDPEGMASLIASIQKDGILQPILVRPLGQKYELVAGERRYRAASSLGLVDIPVVIKKLSDQEAQLLSLAENLQREDLNPVEETEGILSLLSIKLDLSQTDVISLLQQMDHEKRGNIKVNSESAHNVMGRKIVEEIFTDLGLTWQSFLKNRIPLLNLPADVMDSLRSGKIAYTKAVAIAKIKDEKKRGAFLQEAIKKNLSLTEIKERITVLMMVVEKEMTPQVRAKSLWQQMNQQKPWNWSDKRKQKKWERLMQQLEDLLQEDVLE
jgi:ParB family chromosome partitioning protein